MIRIELKSKSSPAIPPAIKLKTKKVMRSFATISSNENVDFDADDVKQQHKES